eukprot:TRINITY_DN65838_c2_g1_i1.p1 TRINITY_DN65838_c2_g1~~TRINITY_DN65838_c2_g1_i1.p1  ORF type:complete len:179 (-),score=25.18 TRINITY_DN65838_c2_g1_i1:111-647(-)
MWRGGFGRAPTNVHKRLLKHGLVEVPVVGDGACQFRSLSHQLFATEERHAEVRAQTVKWLAEHGSKEINGMRISDFLDTAEYPSWPSYCKRMGQPHSWGDHITLVAAAEVYSAVINVISAMELTEQQEQADPPPYLMKIEPLTTPKAPTKQLYLTFYPEFHYNSCQKATEGSCTAPKL